MLEKRKNKASVGAELPRRRRIGCDILSFQEDSSAPIRAAERGTSHSVRCEVGRHMNEAGTTRTPVSIFSDG